MKGCFTDVSDTQAALPALSASAKDAGLMDGADELLKVPLSRLL